MVTRSLYGGIRPLLEPYHDLRRAVPRGTRHLDESLPTERPGHAADCRRRIAPGPLLQPVPLLVPGDAPGDQRRTSWVEASGYLSDVDDHLFSAGAVGDLPGRLCRLSQQLMSTARVGARRHPGDGHRAPGSSAVICCTLASEQADPGAGPPANPTRRARRTSRSPRPNHPFRAAMTRARTAGTRAPAGRGADHALRSSAACSKPNAASMGSGSPDLPHRGYADVGARILEAGPKRGRFWPLSRGPRKSGRIHARSTVTAGIHSVAASGMGYG